ncbi:UNVERIFIED_CONTAM: hypothetical protein Sradi_3959000 [Sesamum radiatum]|uniref:Uncharacterized protein n=1 Tax=Sesamum radiatum TaxID=300843 RepID=A0AAW2PKR1_SESRA
MGDGNHSMWGHLPLLVRANSKESVEYILQALWRTRRTGLDAADRQIFRDILQLQNDSDLDPCVRLSIWHNPMAYMFSFELSRQNSAGAEIVDTSTAKVPKGVARGYIKRSGGLARLKSMTWNMANQNVERTEPTAVISLKLHSDVQPNLGERDVKFQLAKDTMEMMLKSMYCIRDQLSESEHPWSCRYGFRAFHIPFIM